MEHPIFSLSTRKDCAKRHYEHNGYQITITPSVDGLATIHDRDVLIFCISQIVAGINSGREVSQTVRFHASDLLKATNRMTSGRGYELLKKALARLAGTRIETNIITGGKETDEGFGLIESYRIVRETAGGRMLDLEVKLSDWVFNAIESREVLTISRAYFRLRGPLERRLYELARKHCGLQTKWQIGLEKLQKKCGSHSNRHEFKRAIREIVVAAEVEDHFPDYTMEFDGDRRILTFHSRGSVPVPAEEMFEGKLNPDAYGEGVNVAPGWDIYYLEREWRRWCGQEEIEPKNPERHFVKFCQSWFEKRGRP